MALTTIIGIIIGIIVIVGIIGAIMFPRIIANMFMRPKRIPLIKNPSDYGLKYEDVEIKTEDGVKLAGWLIRGTKEKVIILGHPGLFSKYGYSLKHEGLMKSGYKKHVEFVPTAKHLVEAGYTVLMYDQRNHGKSSSHPQGLPHDLPGNVYKDAVAVAKYVSKHPDFKGQDIGLLAICMNSMLNAIAMTKEPEEMRSTNIKAMTVIQPHGIDLWYERAGIPKWVVKGADKIYEKNGMTKMAGWDPLLFVKNIFVPVLFVQNVNDPTSDMDHMHKIYDAIPTEKIAIWIDEEEKHRFHTYNWFNDNPKQLIDFMDKHLSSN